MIGKIIFYNDGMDVYTIIDKNGEEYYGFGNFKIGDIVKFEFHIVNPGKYQTLVAKKIELISKTKAFVITKKI